MSNRWIKTLTALSAVVLAALVLMLGWASTRPTQPQFQTVAVDCSNGIGYVDDNGYPQCAPPGVDPYGTNDLGSPAVPIELGLALVSLGFLAWRAGHPLRDIRLHSGRR